MRQRVSILGGLVVLGLLLFAAAGTIAWWNAWLFLLIILALGLLSFRAINQSPGLAEERRTAAASAPRWDRVVVPLISLALPVVVIVAGIEFRLNWHPKISVYVSGAAFCLLVPVIVLTYQSIAVNAFFSSHVRIQANRGHVVISTGPYRFLRHPGYAGALVFNLLVPVALGSWLALLPGAAVAALLAWRTAKEDMFLMSELSGYSEYAARVQYRLVPGIW